ncbi:MAG: histidine kinase, partial [Spirochaetaceae bacterium]|nr:histidine kinase [Spirochaetaceae bacterium]
MKGLTARLLIFNLLLVVFPIGAVLFLGTYETQLLESQERAMVQQGRLLASALVGHDLAEEAEAILSRLGARTDARLRVVDMNGRLLADSASPPEKEAEVPEETEVSTSSRSSTDEAEAEVAEQDSNEAYPEQTFIYRLGALPARTIRRVSGVIRPPETSAGDAEYYSG